MALFHSQTRRHMMRPSHGFWGTGEKGIYFRGTEEQRPNFEGKKTILRNREHKKTNFRFLGNMGTSQFISGEQGNRYPPPPGRSPMINHFQTLMLTHPVRLEVYILVSISINTYSCIQKYQNLMNCLCHITSSFENATYIQNLMNCLK